MKFRLRTEHVIEGNRREHEAAIDEVIGLGVIHPSAQAHLPLRCRNERFDDCAVTIHLHRYLLPYLTSVDGIVERARLATL